MYVSNKVHSLTGLGVTVNFRCSCPEFLSIVLRQLVLPGWNFGEAVAQEIDVAVQRTDAGTYLIEQCGERVACGTSEEMVPRLASILHHDIASRSKFLIVHAGVVEHRGKVLLFPGRSFAGKSTLVKALVDAGCIYYSDEYAVFEPDAGTVAPFPRGIQLRHPQTGVFYPSTEQCAAPTRRGELGAVFFLNYQENGAFEVRAMSRAQAVLGLFENTVAARRFGQQALHLLEHATRKCRVMTGTRGEATDSSRQILSLVQ
jgi:hypothetical protein